MFGKSKKITEDLACHRINRMLREMVARGEEQIPKDATVGVLCDDGLVLLDLDKKGFGVCMVKSFFRLPDFRLNLTEDQMIEFNGGKGIRKNYFPYRRDT